MNAYKFGNKVYELRKSRGLSQNELGERIGVSGKAVSKWENGNAKPHLDVIRKLAELYELDNIFITPHIAGSLNNECFRMSEYMLGELKRAESGLPLEYGVTLEMLETMA